MRDLPKGIYKRGAKVQAKLTKNGKLVSGPNRATIAEACKDLQALQRGKPPRPRDRRDLPKRVYKHHGRFQGYRAARALQGILVAGHRPWSELKDQIKDHFEDEFKGLNTRSNSRIDSRTN